jgi:hypothetical protein
MFGLSDLSSFRGIGMIVLQVLRAFTIIGLISGIAASVVLIAKVDMSKDYWFFDAVSSSFTVLFSMFFIITELPVFKLLKRWIRGNWPTFSDMHGLTWLGIACIMIGCNILGKLTQPYASQKELGMTMWQLVLAGGILDFVFGGLNIAASLVFADRANRINARDIRAHGSLAERHKDSMSGGVLPGGASGYTGSSHHSPSLRKEKGRSKFVSMFWKKDDEVEDAGKEYVRPTISGPMNPVHRDIERDADVDMDKPRSPIDPNVTRPDSIYHPIHGVRSSSNYSYSVANMSRF